MSGDLFTSVTIAIREMHWSPVTESLFKHNGCWDALFGKRIGCHRTCRAQLLDPVFRKKVSPRRNQFRVDAFRGRSQDGGKQGFQNLLQDASGSSWRCFKAQPMSQFSSSKRTVGDE